MQTYGYVGARTCGRAGVFAEDYAKAFPTRRCHTSHANHQWFTHMRHRVFPPHTPAYLGLVLMALAAVFGCTSATRVGYDSAELELPFAGRAKVALGTLDTRPSVTSGRETPVFAGTLRTDANTASPISTASGNPFATDVSIVVARGLSDGGFQVDSIPLEPGLAEAQAFERLKATGASHLVLLLVREWQVDTFANTELRYDLAIEIRNPAGALQGKSRLSGSDQLPAAHADSAEVIERTSRDALAHKLGVLFAEPSVAAAFQREL